MFSSNGYKKIIVDKETLACVGLALKNVSRKRKELDVKARQKYNTFSEWKKWLNSTWLERKILDAEMFDWDNEQLLKQFQPQLENLLKSEPEHEIYVSLETLSALNKYYYMYPEEIPLTQRDTIPSEPPVEEINV